MKRENGYIIWEGASVLDGEPIALIATTKTSNEKTGNVIQTWIIRTDMDPVTASKKKKDGAICGNCPQRQNVGGSCYVNIGQAPNAVYKALKRGSYPVADWPTIAKHWQGRVLRLGSYGDPAAVPFDVWSQLVDCCKSHLGYTHQHNHASFDKRILKFCMLSTENARTTQRAHSSQIRTFRMKLASDPLLKNEVLCPNETTGVQCVDCGACYGGRHGMPKKMKSIAINAHGALASRFAKPVKSLTIDLVNL